MTSFILHDRPIFRSFLERVEELIDEIKARVSKAIKAAMEKIKKVSGFPRKKLKRTIFRGIRNSPNYFTSILA